MSVKSTPLPAKILERIACEALSYRILCDGTNKDRRERNQSLIKVGETYNKLTTEEEKTIMKDLKSDDTQNVRADVFGW